LITTVMAVSFQWYFAKNYKKHNIQTTMQLLHGGFYGDPEMIDKFGLGKIQ
jgi:hypothetical protein